MCAAHLFHCARYVVLKAGMPGCYDGSCILSFVVGSVGASVGLRVAVGYRIERILRRDFMNLIGRLRLYKW